MDLTFWLGNIFWILMLLLNGMVLLRLFRSRFGKTKSVRAEVIGKQTVEFFSKYADNRKRVRHVVIFQTKNGKKSFYVSEFSYNGYRKGEHGTLTYKGDRLIDFT